MMKNRIKEFRKAKKLTQTQLAKAAETTQQSIQRIESGAQVARKELALRICTALEKDPLVVFPGMRAILAAEKRARKAGKEPGGDDLTTQYENEAGIDVDQYSYSLNVMLRSGHQDSFPISSATDLRLRRCINHGKGFACFDTPTHNVALNLDQIVYAEFMWTGFGSSDELENEQAEDLEVYVVGREEPLTFGVDADTGSLDDDDSGRSVQLQDLLMSLDDYSHDSCGDEQFVYFMDRDGERVFLRVDTIALLTVPLLLTNRDLLKSMAEGDDEDEEEPSPQAAE